MCDTYIKMSVSLPPDVLEYLKVRSAVNGGTSLSRLIALAVQEKAEREQPIKTSNKKQKNNA